MRMADTGTFNEKMDLLLREVTHRCANDLQLVLSLLRLQARRAKEEDVRQALSEAADRVGVLAEARTLSRDEAPTLEAALQQVCSALNSQAEPRSILISLEFAADARGLPDDKITCLALCVNELATNAIKHGYTDGRGGRVSISVDTDEGGELRISVTDDGSRLLAEAECTSQGLGLGLVRRLLRSVGMRLREPTDGSKRFEIVTAGEAAKRPASAESLQRHRTRSE